MKENVVLKTTTNRSTFNSLYKNYLEKNGGIRCTYCGYHKGENNTDKWYVKNFKNPFYGEREINRYPSWKLVSKNKKQWMKKPIKYIKTKDGYYEIMF